MFDNLQLRLASLSVHHLLICIIYTSSHSSKYHLGQHHIDSFQNIFGQGKNAQKGRGRGYYVGAECRLLRSLVSQTYREPGMNQVPKSQLSVQATVRRVIQVLGRDPDLVPGQMPCTKMAST